MFFFSFGEKKDAREKDDVQWKHWLMMLLRDRDREREGEDRWSREDRIKKKKKHGFVFGWGVHKKKQYSKTDEVEKTKISINLR